MTDRHQYQNVQELRNFNMPQTHRSNFNSNDGAVLQNRIRELQEELDLLGAEEMELENESEMLREETDNIKRHNKALFDQITTN